MSSFITIEIPFVNSPAEPSAMLSITHRNRRESLTQPSENRAHGLRFPTFRPSWPVLIVPTIKIKMRVTDTVGYEPFQEQSSNNRSGERFG
jgi:hypothetical protein